jgi:hypothetical protein
MPKGKLRGVVDLLRRAEGATAPQTMEARDWQAHSVSYRGQRCLCFGMKVIDTPVGGK